MRPTSVSFGKLTLLAALLVSGWMSAQDTVVKPQDSTAEVKIRRYGLRVGVDLYKLTRGLYDKDYKGLELVGDFRLSAKYYLAAELGTEDKRDDHDRLDFSTKGQYIRLGFDYNSYQNWLDMENVISIGGRYGFSTFSQRLNAYKIYNPNPYFGEELTIPSGQEFSGLNASWLELVVGMKAEVLHNIFLGFSFRVNYLLAQKQPDGFENLYIPGFHRTYDSGKIGVGFNYTVSYFIPLFRTEKVLEKKK